MRNVKFILSPDRRCCRRALCILVFLGFSGFAIGQDARVVFLKGPYLQGPGEDTMTIKWESSASGTGVVRYGLEGKQDREFRVEAPRSMAAESYVSVTNVADNGETNITRNTVTQQVYLYAAGLSNLQSESVYSYSVEMDGQQTAPKKFKTLGKHQAKLTIVAYGDNRSNPTLHAAVAANFKRYSPDFILHMGDLVGDGRRYELWG